MAPSGKNPWMEPSQVEPTRVVKEKEDSRDLPPLGAAPTTPPSRQEQQCWFHYGVGRGGGDIHARVQVTVVGSGLCALGSGLSVLGFRFLALGSGFLAFQRGFVLFRFSSEINFFIFAAYSAIFIASVSLVCRRVLTFICFTSLSRVSLLNVKAGHSQIMCVTVSSSSPHRRHRGDDSFFYLI